MSVNRSRCIIALFMLVACGTTTPPAPSFSVLKQGETAALLSIWGTSSSDVWVTGARPSATANPTIVHLAGGVWTRIDSNQSGIDLWWVFGFAGGDIFFSGSGGTILRYRGGNFEKLQTPSSTATIFGMWGPTSEDVWAVGRATAMGPGVALWHFDGTTWSSVDPPTGFPTGLLAFKVHGQRSDDVWISCSGGATLHWNGSALEYLPTGTQASLFSIVTTSSEVVTAGDMSGTTGTGALYENDGTGWQAAALAVPAAWRGVAGSTDEVYAVGDSGIIAHRDAAGAWSTIKQTLIQLAFHAAWIDPDGGFWGVGGLFDSQPLSDGFLLYFGTADIPRVTN
ncbi:MAG: hypothetical protein JWO36_4452 [Myxococcales bacterium]|nr:hypothetical protein [Myxococcales bacterium]